MNACQGEEGGQEGGVEGKGRGISPPRSFLKLGAHESDAITVTPSAP